MSNIEHGKRLVDIRTVKVLGLPVGAFIDRHSFPGYYEQDKIGIKNANEILETEDLLIFDAHRFKTDVLAAGAVTSQVINASTLIVPAAIYLYEKQFSRKLIEEVGKLEGVEICWVGRKQDMEKGGRRDIKKKISREKARSLATEFFKKIDQIRGKPHCAAFIAPYGSRELYRTEVKQGVRRALRNGSPAICTYAVWNRHEKIYYVMFSSNVLRFSPDASDKEIDKAVDIEYELLEQRENYYKNKPSSDYFSEI